MVDIDGGAAMRLGREHVGDVVQSQRLDPARRQLQHERNAICSATQVGDRGCRLGRQAEGPVNAARAIDEEPGSGRGGDRCQ
jgi:hypothetical protein